MLICPASGSRQVPDYLQLAGHQVNRKRLQLLMHLIGVVKQCIQKRCTTVRNGAHKIYPYLLRGVSAERPNYVWSIDITYGGLQTGYMHLTAIIDWFSRYVVSWWLSHSLVNDLCLAGLNEGFTACEHPEILSSDHTSQFTATNFIAELTSRDIRIRMDGAKEEHLVMNILRDFGE